MKILILFLLFIISGISYASENIKFHDGGNNTFVVELNSDKDIGEKKGLDIIAKASEKKCGNKPAHFGKYRFQGKEQVTSSNKASDNSFRMVQQLFCGELPLSTQDATKPLRNQEKAQLENKARKLTDTYLEYLAKRNFKKAYSLLSAPLKQDKKFKEWKKAKKQITEDPGKLLRSEIWGVTTYVDPPSSPRKGIYIAIDFDREYSTSPIYCGYLVWYLEGDNLKVIREDIGRINSDQFNKMKEYELTAIKAKFRCKPLTSKGSG